MQFKITKTSIYRNNILKIGIIQYKFYLLNLAYKNCSIDNITKLFIMELIKYQNCLIYLIENKIVVKD